MTSTASRSARFETRLPFFYGWAIVAVAFVTMAIGVNARTAFSLLFPSILAEFGWDRAVTAGVFSFGFLASAAVSPLMGRLMDRRGPRFVVETGAVTMAIGLLLATLGRTPWHLYATLGMLVGIGGNWLGYTAHALFLSRWFVRRRGLATSIAFAGVGAGSIVVLPWLETVITRGGWRAACWALGVLVLVLVAPLNVLLRGTPQEVGLAPDGDDRARDGIESRATTVVDARWVAVEWTIARALATARFWWIAVGYASGMFAWYAVQVHQTKYLVEVGIAPADAAWALGLVSLVAVPGQIALGHLSDRFGREWIWTVGNVGFALCYLVLLRMADAPTSGLLYLMVVMQGMLGYGLTSVIGAIPAEIFEGPHYGTIFGTLMLAAIVGGAAGPWITGLAHDATGSYTLGFWLAIAATALSALAIWLAAPRKVRRVAGRAAPLTMPR